MACQRSREALQLLRALHAEPPEFRTEAVSLLTGRAQQKLGQHDKAKASLEAAVQCHGCFESKADLAIWAYETGELSTAHALERALQHISHRWNSATRNLNADAMQRLKQARDQGTKAAGN